MTRERRLLLRGVQIVLAALVIWGAYRTLAPELRGLRWEDLAAWRPRALPLIASLLLLTVMYLMHAWLWRRIMRDLGAPAASARASLRVYFLASLGRYIPGKLWQLAGLIVLAQGAGMPRGTAAAAAVFGQLGFLTSGLFLTALLLPEWAGGTPAWIGAALLTLAGITIWLLAATPLGHGLRARLAASGAALGERAGAALTVADRVRPANAALWEAGYALSWVVLGVAFTLFVHAFTPVALADAPWLAGTIAASYLAGYVVLVAPAGVGVRESALALLLMRVVPDASAAVVISIVSRLWFTAAELLPFALLPLLPRNAPEAV